VQSGRVEADAGMGENGGGQGEGEIEGMFRVRMTLVMKGRMRGCL
jgi:hypothetical protein